MHKVDEGVGVDPYDPALDDDLDAAEIPDHFRRLIERPPSMQTVAPLSVLDVASAILAAKGPMSTYQLQKLCYYAQAHYVSAYNTRLFREPIEAWPNGPVIPELYRRQARRRHVDQIRGGSAAAVAKQPAAAVMLQFVLDEYGSFNGDQLVELTHREQPWRDARQGLPARQASHNEISLEALRDYYRGFERLVPSDDDG